MAANASRSACSQQRSRTRGVLIIIALSHTLLNEVTTQPNKLRKTRKRLLICGLLILAKSGWQKHALTLEDGVSGPPLPKWSLTRLRSRSKSSRPRRPLDGCDNDPLNDTETLVMRLTTISLR
jgi:hypothetical protein